MILMKENGSLMNKNNFHSYLNSDTRFCIEDESGNILAYPVFLTGLCHHIQDDRYSLSFFDETRVGECVYFIEDDSDIISIK